MEILALIILITIIWAIIKIITKIISFIARLFKSNDIQRLNIGTGGNEVLETVSTDDLVTSENK